MADGAPQYLSTDPNAGAPQYLSTDPNAGKPATSNTVKVGGTPLNLTTGEGAPTYDPNTQQQMEQAHGAVSLMGHPAGSIAQEKSFENAITSPVPSVENAPPGSKAMAEAGADIPILASSAAVIPAAGAAIEGLGAKIASKIPNAERAAQSLNQASKIAGDMPVEVRNSGQAALDFKKISETGGGNSQVINRFLNRVTAPGAKPLTYDEARMFYTNASRLSAEEMSHLNPVARRQMGIFAQALGQDIQKTAEHGGVLEELQSGLKEYRSAKVMEGRFDDAKEMAKQAIKKGIPYAAALWAAHKIIFGE